MKIEKTSGELAELLDGLEAVAQTDRMLPALTAYSIAEAVAVLRRELEPYKMVRAQVVRRYANGKDTLRRDDDPAAFDACVREIDKIGAKTLQVDLPKIRLKDLDGVQFTAAEMTDLRILIAPESEDN